MQWNIILNIITQKATKIYFWAVAQYFNLFICMLALKRLPEKHYATLIKLAGCRNRQKNTNKSTWEEEEKGETNMAR